jgi:hypothetical protein
MIAVVLAGVIPACHGSDVPETEVGGPMPPQGPSTTQVVFQATNYDVFDYAVWIEWQDDSGQWIQTYLFSVYGDPTVGPTTNDEIVLANPTVPYYILLADFGGTLYDTYTLSIPAATSLDVTFNIVDGTLYRTF